MQNYILFLIFTNKKYPIFANKAFYILNYGLINSDNIVIQF